MLVSCRLRKEGRKVGVGVHMKNIIREKGLTIKNVSEKSGVSVNTLYSITKRDSVRVDCVILSRIAEALGVRVQDLIGDETEVCMTYGQRMKAIRKEKGLTQKQVANGCGMADSAIRKYESGLITPKLETLQRIAEALGVPILDLLGVDKSEGNADLKRKGAEEMTIDTAKVEILMAEQGLNQKELGERCGMPRQNISSIIRRGDVLVNRPFGKRHRKGKIVLFDFVKRGLRRIPFVRDFILDVLRQLVVVPDFQVRPLCPQILLVLPFRRLRAVHFPINQVSIIIAACVLALVAVVGIFVGVQQKQASDRAAYIASLNELRAQTIRGGSVAEKMCNLTKQVWYNTIYEERDSITDKYTRSGGVFHDDFNTSLSLLYAEDNTATVISGLQASRELVDGIMADLQNPPAEFAVCYEAADSLYDAYCGLIDFPDTDDETAAEMDEAIKRAPAFAQTPLCVESSLHFDTVHQSDSIRSKRFHRLRSLCGNNLRHRNAQTASQLSDRSRLRFSPADNGADILARHPAPFAKLFLIQSLLRHQDFYLCCVDSHFFCSFLFQIRVISAFVNAKQVQNRNTKRLGYPLERFKFWLSPVFFPLAYALIGNT